MSKRKLQWHSKRFKLADDHGWQASPDHNVFVADQGAVRFEFPHSWVIEPIEGDIAIGIYNRKPPDDDVRLAVSVMHLPQRVDWSGMPLDMLVRQVFLRQQSKDAGRDLRWQPNIRTVATVGSPSEVTAGLPNRSPSSYIETAWAQGDFIDPNERRPARTRAGLARGGRDYIVQAQITMDYWLDDANRFEPIWDHVFTTIRLGEIIPNPITHRDS